MHGNSAGPKSENSYQKLNVPREQQEQQHSNPSHDYVAKAAGKNATIAKSQQNIIELATIPDCQARQLESGA